MEIRMFIMALCSEHSHFFEPSIGGISFANTVCYFNRIPRAPAEIRSVCVLTERIPGGRRGPTTKILNYLIKNADSISGRDFLPGT